MFVWRELMTDDVEAARRFYGELFSWTWKGEDMGPGGKYWLASLGGRQIAGAMAKPPAPPMPTSWSSYVLTDDVDATASRCKAAGGRVLKEPMDIPNVGRFAVLSDRWGAVFLPFRSSVEESAPPRGMPPPGTFCWETLVTPDVEGAIAFYAKVVGFGTGPTPNGEGKVFTAGDAPVADLQPARGGGASYWSTYVAVERAEATRDRAVRLGGKVIVPRIDIPKVGVISVIADPSGAALGLFQPGA
jgi:predicted enzyme related to lactoylglutathione lyase